MMTSPDFTTLSRIEETLLLAQLQAVRASISHPGEKGRALESHVRKLLRQLLPAEYGLTTGFIVWLTKDGPELSSQLDIIIYDATRYSPLISLEGCDVLPLEAVFAYVEVKASLRANASPTSRAEDSIAVCARRNAAIRRMTTRWFSGVLGSPMVVDDFDLDWLAVRAYIVAFEVSGTATTAAKFAIKMASAMKLERAHIHGVFVPHLGFFYTRPVDRNAPDEDRAHVRYTTDHPLAAFKALLLKGLASFQRPDASWTPALHKYFDQVRLWEEKGPPLPSLKQSNRGQRAAKRAR